MSLAELAASWAWVGAGGGVAFVIWGWRGGRRWPVLAVIALGLMVDVAIVQKNLTQHREWDVLAFWLPAVAAIEGADPWQEGALEEVETPFEVTDGFRREVIESGFLHPPTGLLPYLWMGVLPFEAAATIWYAFLGLGVFLLARRLGGLEWGEGRGLGSGLLLALLVLLLPTHLAIANGQTAPWVVLLLAVALQLGGSAANSNGATRGSGRRRVGDGASWVEGVALGLAVILKPYAAAVLLPWAIARRWVACIATAGTVLASGLLATMLLGPRIWGSWIERLDRVPTEQFLETQNQSIGGLLGRFGLVGAESLPFHAVVVGAGVVWALVVVALAWRVVRVDKAGGWRWRGVLIAAVVGGAWLYPGTLKHYLVVVILAAAWALAELTEAAGGSMRVRVSVAGAIMSAWAVMAVARGNVGGLVLPVVWIAIVLAVIWTRRASGCGPRNEGENKEGVRP